MVVFAVYLPYVGGVFGLINPLLIASWLHFIVIFTLKFECRVTEAVSCVIVVKQRNNFKSE